MVDEADFQLTAVARVDESRGVEAGHAVLERQTTPGLHETGIAVGKRDRDSRRYERPATSRSEGYVLTSDEIDTGVAASGVGREG